MNTRDLAERRQQQWLDKHGKHIWEERDLWQEAQEELADAYNYLKELGQKDLAEECLTVGDYVLARHDLFHVRGSEA